MQLRLHKKRSTCRGMTAKRASDESSKRNVTKKKTPKVDFDLNNIKSGEVPGSKVNLNPTRIGFDSTLSNSGGSVSGISDPIHQPLINDYRRTMGLPPGGVDEFGNQVGPTDAELKYGGILTRSGNVQWLSPVINRRNFAEIQFKSSGMSGTGGLTTLFINAQEINSNHDVENAIPPPAISHRIENNQCHCWFNRGINVSGHSKLDIFTNGPWDFQAPRNEAASKYSWKPSCVSGSGLATIHIDARPDDASMEQFIRQGEGEHHQDQERLFRSDIGSYVANVNRLVGDTSQSRMTGTDLNDCSSKLRQQANRSILTQFVHNLNAATAIRHRNSRHSIAHTGININTDCTRINEVMVAGTL